MPEIITKMAIWAQMANTELRTIFHKHTK